MARARFFLSDSIVPTDGLVVLPLSESDVKHAIRVLRVAPGEELDVVEPSGAGWRVTVTQTSDRELLVRVDAPLGAAWSPQVTLFQGVAKGEKMDTIVRQAVEVGVTRVVPVITSRTIVRMDAAKRVQRGERWRRIAEAAAKQSSRDHIPHVHDPIDVDDALPLLGEHDVSAVLWEEFSGELLGPALRARLLNPDMSIALFVGPEGGLSAEECDKIIAAGAVPASLGPAIMRTETAAVVVTALAVATARELRCEDG